MAETFGQRFDQHTDDIIATTELLKELADRIGLYVWEKYTAQGGDSLGYVVADDENSYPNGGELDGYYYELLSNPVDLAKELDLIPQNIREGVNIFDVIGAMKAGTEYGVFYKAVDSNGRPTDAEIIMPNISAYDFYFHSESAHMLYDIKKIKIVTKQIGMYAFQYAFKGGNKKIKIDAEYIMKLSFHTCANGNKVWISKKCTTIDGTDAYSCPFYTTSNATMNIYCEPTAKPSGWGDYWNNLTSSGKATTTWGVTEEQFDAL